MRDLDPRFALLLASQSVALFAMCVALGAAVLWAQGARRGCGCSPTLACLLE